jgi:hypothetical protein
MALRTDYIDRIANALRGNGRIVHLPPRELLFCGEYSLAFDWRPIGRFHLSFCSGNAIAVANHICAINPHATRFAASLISDEFFSVYSSFR